MFKTWSPAVVQRPARPPEPVVREAAKRRPRQDGNLVALVDNRLERISLDDDALGYNLTDHRILVRYKRNDRGFDEYIGLPFTKGVTERGTGRTQLILGSAAHHIEAMQNQFAGVLWTEDMKSYGDTIRWINVGDLRRGFIGLDYHPGAPADAGVATTADDVRFLAQTLLSFGYDGSKQLFLLEPPYLKESEYGKSFRAQGFTILDNYAR